MGHCAGRIGRHRRHSLARALNHIVKIAILKETAAGERRVAGTPETVKKFKALGAELVVEAGAGAASSIADQAYADAGATVTNRADAIKGADILLGVQGPDPVSLDGVKAGAWIVAGLNPFGERARVDAYAGLGVDALAMEFMPRITRAQSMDILSSQSNLSGYKAVLDAAGAYDRAFPMMMTAAGTVSAARVFVMGVGVAGLQAIATARRLGAQVSATDVRSATREQIESLGAKAIFVDDVKGIEGEGSGGYATEMSDEYKAAQAALACRRAACFAHGTHTILVGEMMAGTVEAQVEPLLYVDGGPSTTGTVGKLFSNFHRS